MAYEMGLHQDLDRARKKREAAEKVLKVARGRRDGTVQKKTHQFIRATLDQLRIENKLKRAEDCGEVSHA